MYNTFLKYTSDLLNLEFFYPSSFNTINETNNPTLLELKGNSDLNNLKIYKDLEILNVAGDYETLYLESANLGLFEIKIYENGLELNQEKIVFPTFISEINYKDSKYTIIGNSTINRPKTSREIFIKIIQSIK